MKKVAPNDKEKENNVFDDSFNFANLEILVSQEEAKTNRDRSSSIENLVLGPSRGPSQSSCNYLLKLV